MIQGEDLLFVQTLLPEGLAVPTVREGEEMEVDAPAAAPTAGPSRAVGRDRALSHVSVSSEAAAEDARMSHRRPDFALMKRVGTQPKVPLAVFELKRFRRQYNQRESLTEYFTSHGPEWYDEFMQKSLENLGAQLHDQVSFAMHEAELEMMKAVAISGPFFQAFEWHWNGTAAELTILDEAMCIWEPRGTELSENWLACWSWMTT